MSLIFQDSTRRGPLSDSLNARGYQLQEAFLGGKLLVRMTSPSGRSWLSGANMSYPMNSHAVYELSGDKQRTYQVADALNIAIPLSIYVQSADITPELSRLLSDGVRLIVKPLDSFKAKGVTLNITDETQLADAINTSFKESPTAIVQEQVEGEEYRFSVLNGKVVSVLRRERPQVTGNGIDTISQLVAHENELRRNLENALLPYPQWTFDLLGESIESDDVLALGERRLLSGTTLVSRGASVYELIDKVDDSYVQIAEQFAQEIAGGFVAVDMFLQDHTQVANASNYRFNECNAAPSLKMYLAPRNRNTEHVIEMVVDEVDKALNKI